MHSNRTETITVFNKCEFLVFKAIRFFILAILAFGVPEAMAASDPNSVKPIGEAVNHRNWVLVESLSDEFNNAKLDQNKWNNDPNSWGTWSWEPQNVKEGNGMLAITMTYKPHKRGKMQLMLTSGIIKSHQMITYGYFEARMKAAPLLPGTCPAFWMIGNGPGHQNRICEVDFMELRESNPLKFVATNLHAHVDADGDGTLEWVRQNRDWPMTWDPRDNFHLYACEVTPERIIWYIDGVKVNEAPNLHWHFPMNVIVSMGPRSPYRVFEKPEDIFSPEGTRNWPAIERTRTDRDQFPTTMLVDYIRVWKRQ